MVEDIHTLILYSSEVPQLVECAQDIYGTLQSHGFDVTLQTVSDSTVPHLCAANILIMGSNSHGMEFEQGDYQELNRALAGINFSGRLGGFFTVSNPRSIDSLKKMVKDTGIRLLENELYYTHNNFKNQLLKWIADLGSKIR